MSDIQVSEKLISFLTFLPFFFISLAVHEFAHAYTAHKKGDNTAKNQGRLTLNPIKHIDLFGSVLMPFMAFASGFALIGWAKPVPIDRRNFRNQNVDDALVSFAGPASNLILAILFFIIFMLVTKLSVDFTYREFVINMIWFGVYFNIFLALFNLLPLPPLDGSHILYDLFPNRFTASLLNLGIYGSILLIFFIYSPLWKYFFGLVNFILDGFLFIGGYK
ncbi:MAG: site-2 protease family protein [Ignavibacteria bacterium]|jgi:Zn-dependent protease|nr:site-2 protease family protein [Ignavibacteria bacterium]MDP3830644.1 site-2 protease family protein [Ignavibacteriaceae bacterium]